MTRSIFIATALALAITLPAVSANAQGAIRTFVSTTGSDSNPCSITSPCRHFSAAVAATSVGGEVDALEAGSYGSFTISQAITIEGQGWSYVAPPDGGNGITIKAGSGKVTIHGVSINGVGTTGGTNGIAIDAPSTGTITLSGLILEGGGASAHGIYLNSGVSGELNIIDTTVTNFTNSGITILPVGSQINVLISNSYSLHNGQHGIKIAATGGGGGAQVLYEIDHTTASGNSVNGFDFEATSGNGVAGGLSQSVAGLNNNVGIYVSAAGAEIFNCGLVQNSSYGLSVANGGLVTLSSSSFVNGNLDVTTDSNNGSTVSSFGNNAYSFYSGNIVQQSLH
jgi:hypothetical protein